jgi:presenilin-like A22 family membrane protease
MVMKYELKIIFILIFLFFISQIVGLAILYKDIKVEVIDGMTEVVHTETIIGPRPDFYGPQSFIWMVSSILLMTGVLLLLIRFEKINWVKILFFSASFTTLSVALGVLMEPIFAYTIAFVLAVVKIFKPNKITHNMIEMLMYSGLVVLLVPLFDVTWMIALLIVISVYDIYAVWHSKHMVKMANFQIKSNIFSGIFIPLKESGKIGKKIKKATKKVKQKTVKVQQAIMGGGDVAFPLLFSGVVMESLIKVNQLTKEMAFFKTLIIPVMVTISL